MRKPGSNRHRSRRSWRAIFAAAGALVGIWACNTPSVPLPPPDIQQLGFLSAGLGVVEVQGKPAQQHANARFYVYNRSRGDGVITPAGADGSFTTSPFAGTDGDLVEIYLDTRAGERSPSACVQIRVNIPLLSIPCP